MLDMSSGKFYQPDFYTNAKKNKINVEAEENGTIWTNEVIKNVESTCEKN